MQNVLDKLAPSINIRTGGAGNKAIKMMDEEESDFMIHVVRGLKYWDLCAAEALMRGRFGIVTDKDGQPIIYDETRTDGFTVMNGIIFSRTEDIYKMCYGRIEELLKELKMGKGLYH